MPIYEFSCPECGHEFDELVPSASARPRAVCPRCGKDTVQKRLSLFAARSHEGTSRTNQPVPPGGCGRCGDPAGPCGLT
ncbi:MAG: zinc ribbon domain-containing protein [Planctomycetia bacterium]|nr:MAG: zinc ribbon domain-containing protein [Planctomycetia bacterium]